MCSHERERVDGAKTILYPHDPLAHARRYDGNTAIMAAPSREGHDNRYVRRHGHKGRPYNVQKLVDWGGRRRSRALRADVLSRKETARDTPRRCARGRASPYRRRGRAGYRRRRRCGCAHATGADHGGAARHGQGRRGMRRTWGKRRGGGKRMGKAEPVASLLKDKGRLRRTRTRASPERRGGLEARWRKRARDLATARSRCATTGSRGEPAPRRRRG